MSGKKNMPNDLVRDNDSATDFFDAFLQTSHNQTELLEFEDDKPELDGIV